MYTKVSPNIRSLCSLVCKWNYRAGSGDSSKDGWDWSFLDQIGLGAKLKLEQLGTEVVSPGSSMPRGLSEQAAREMGLNCATKVGGILKFEHGCDGDQKGVFYRTVPHISSSGWCKHDQCSCWSTGNAGKSFCTGGGISTSKALVSMI